MSGRQESRSFHSESSDFVLKCAAQPAGAVRSAISQVREAITGHDPDRAGSETPDPTAGRCSSEGTIDSSDGYGPLTPVAGKATHSRRRPSTSDQHAPFPSTGWPARGAVPESSLRVRALETRRIKGLNPWPPFSRVRSLLISSRSPKC